MELYVGSGLLTGHISHENINHIIAHGDLPYISLWEKIKDFFFTTNIQQAMKCVDILSRPDKKSYNEFSDSFNMLKNLSAPGCHKYFETEPMGQHVRFSIKDNIGNIIIDVKIPLNDYKTPFMLAEKIDKIYPKIAQIDLEGIKRLIVFGDSLSDSNGRMFKKTHHVFPSYSQYYDGRFTNGYVWSEYLSSPAFLNTEIINFAEGGSTSASYSCLNFLGDFLSNLNKQMNNYNPSGKDLAIFLLGANDYMTLHKKDILKVVEQQIDDIKKLLSLGVEHVLAMGVPDLSGTPYAEGSNDKRKFKDVSIAHNELLKENIQMLQIQNPKHKILYFDTSSAFLKIREVADEVGYDTTHSYIEHGYIHIPGTQDPELNINPKYIYNDKVHPTQEVHHAFAIILNSFIRNNYASATVVS